MSRKKKPADVQLDADELELETERLNEAIEAKEKALKKLRKLKLEEKRLGAGVTASDNEEEQLPGAERMAQILEELHGAGSFTVVKIEGSKTIDVGTYDLNYWPDAMDSAVEEAGDGTYIIMVRDGSGQMVTRIKRNYKGKGRSAAAPAGGDPFKFFELFQRSEERHAKELETMRLELGRAQAENSKNMLEFLKSQGGSVVSQAQQFAALKDIFGGDKKGGLDFKSIKDAIEFVDSVRGDEPEPPTVSTNNPLVVIADRIAGAIAAAMAAKAAAPAGESKPAALPAPQNALTKNDPPPPAATAPRPAGAPRQPAAEAPAASSPAAGAEAEVEAAKQRQLYDLRQYVTTLAAAINAGMTPELAAASVRDNAQKNGEMDNLVVLLERGDWDGLKSAAELKDHAVWIDALRLKLGEPAKTAEQPAPAPVAEVAPEEKPAS